MKVHRPIFDGSDSNPQFCVECCLFTSCVFFACPAHEFCDIGELVKIESTRGGNYGGSAKTTNIKINEAWMRVGDRIRKRHRNMRT